MAPPSGVMDESVSEERIHMLSSGTIKGSSQFYPTSSCQLLTFPSTVWAWTGCWVPSTTEMAHYRPQRDFLIFIYAWPHLNWQTLTKQSREHQSQSLMVQKRWSCWHWLCTCSAWRSPTLLQTAVVPSTGQHHPELPQRQTCYTRWWCVLYMLLFNSVSIYYIMSRKETNS
jgi:hypothetical protein